MIIDLDGTVSGSGNDDIGNFTIEGKFNDGWLEFKKQYETIYFLTLCELF